MDLDILYYYKAQSPELIGKPKKGIKMSDCIEIFEKDMTKSKEKGFSFTINLGERLYHFMADTESERKNWVSCL